MQILTGLVETSKEHGSIYTDIENTRKELAETQKWIEDNELSEDVKGTSQLVPMRNKVKRLTAELDALFCTQKEVEGHATSYINAERIARRSEDQARGIDTAIEEITKLLKLGVKFTHLARAQEELLTFRKKKTQDINMFEHIKSTMDFIVPDVK